MTVEHLVLDSRIRDWVLFPIVLVMFIVSILRHNITLLMQTRKKVPLKTIQEQQALQRARCLRMNGRHIPAAAFARRQKFLCHKEDGFLSRKIRIAEKAKKDNPMAQMSDPTMMFDMVKRQMSMMVPQIALMSWVSFMFSGFVLMRFPFPLTLSFKAMLQRGIDLDSLDPSYVTSLSWYFLNVLALRGILYIVLGEGSASDDTAMMAQQMGQSSAGQPMDVAKVFTAEKDSLELSVPRWVGAGAIERILASETEEEVDIE